MEKEDTWIIMFSNLDSDLVLLEEDDIRCPSCKHVYKVEWLKDLTCPNCGNNTLYWDSCFMYDEDGNIEDEWFFVREYK